MRTKGSSTETSLGREKGCLKRTATTNPRSHRQARDQASPLYSPASRHHQLHLDPVGYQDSQHLLVGSLLHAAIGKRELGQGSRAPTASAPAMKAHGIPYAGPSWGCISASRRGCSDLQLLSPPLFVVPSHHVGLCGGVARTQLEGPTG